MYTFFEIPCDVCIFLVSTTFLVWMSGWMQAKWNPVTTFLISSFSLTSILNIVGLILSVCHCIAASSYVLWLQRSGQIQYLLQSLILIVRRPESILLRCPWGGHVRLGGSLKTQQRNNKNMMNWTSLQLVNLPYLCLFSYIYHLWGLKPLGFQIKRQLSFCMFT